MYNLEWIYLSGMIKRVLVKDGGIRIAMVDVLLFSKVSSSIARENKYIIIILIYYLEDMKNQ